MPKQEKRSAASHEDESALVALNPKIVEVLADFWFPPLDEEVDLETAAEALTEQDRQALAALGSPSELVARVVAAAKTSSCPTPQAGVSTEKISCEGASTQITGRRQPAASTREFDKVLKRLGDFGEIEALSWNSAYRNKGMIGEGGQGIVFLIECINEHNLPKALKVFSPKPYGPSLASYDEDMDRMAHVASLIYRMQLDNLVIVERCDYHEDLSLMIMRWIDGYDLARLLQPSVLERLHGCVGEERWHHLNNVVVTTPGTRQLRLMPGMAVNIIEKCLRALAALHSNNIVHGDIKPSNIMLDRYGGIRLIDIGSAFQLSAPPCQHTWTPRYAAPETFGRRRKWTPQSDLASLGYVLIELLSGQPAVDSPDIGSASTRELESAKYDELRQAQEMLPERLDELLPDDVKESRQLMNICRRLTNPDPKRRFASAEEALEGPDGTYQFLQSLTRMGLSVLYSQEIRRWLRDVKRALASSIDPQP